MICSDSSENDSLETRLRQSAYCNWASSLLRDDSPAATQVEWTARPRVESFGSSYHGHLRTSREHLKEATQFAKAWLCDTRTITADRSFQLAHVEALWDPIDQQPWQVLDVPGAGCGKKVGDRVPHLLMGHDERSIHVSPRRRGIKDAAAMRPKNVAKLFQEDDDNLITPALGHSLVAALKEGDGAQRLHVTQAVSVLGHAKTAEYVAPLLADSDVRLQRRAAQALNVIGVAAAPSVAGVLCHSAPDHSCRGALFLGERLLREVASLLRQSTEKPAYGAMARELERLAAAGSAAGMVGVATVPASKLQAATQAAKESWPCNRRACSVTSPQALSSRRTESARSVTQRTPRQLFALAPQKGIDSSAIAMHGDRAVRLAYGRGLGSSAVGSAMKGGQLRADTPPLAGRPLDAPPC